MKHNYEYPKNGYIDSATRLGHKVWGITHLFGMDYAWMIDPEGTYYPNQIGYLMREVIFIIIGMFAFIVFYGLMVGGFDGGNDDKGGFGG